jgi:hypothetical protein
MAANSCCLHAGGVYLCDVFMEVRDAICLTICILSLAGLFAHSISKPERNHVASLETKRLMHKVHGVWGLECRGTKCSFERDGKTIYIRLK